MKRSAFCLWFLMVIGLVFWFSTVNAQTHNCQCYDECMNIVCCTLSYHTEYTNNRDKIVMVVTGYAAAAPLSWNIWNYCEWQDFKNTGCRQPRPYLETTWGSVIELNTVDAMFMEVTVYNILNETVKCSVMAVKTPIPVPSSVMRYLSMPPNTRWW